MTGHPLDLAEPYRTAIIASDVAELLGQWEGEPAVITRRPIPNDVEKALVLVGPEVGMGDMDWVNTSFPVSRRDIFVYGHQGNEVDGDYRDVEMAAFRLRELFQRAKDVLTVPGYHVVNITVFGPWVAPTDDDEEVGRGVTVTTHLQKVG